MLNKATDLSEWMERHTELNTLIHITKGIEFTRHDLETRLELIDEICELMNKTRAHKYWSDKGPEPEAVLLDEYADIWLMSFKIGNDLEMTGGHHGIDMKHNLLKQFDAMLFSAHVIYNPIGWHSFISLLKGLGLLLGFTSEKVEAAVLEKWETNIKRQKEGY